MRKYILALDISLRNTGYTVFTNDGNFVTTNSIETSAEDLTQRRLGIIGETMLDIIDSYEIDKVVMESSFSRYNLSTEQLYRVHGLINYLFRDYEQVYYAPATIRKVVAGKGNIKKQEMRDLIAVLYPKIEFDNLDQSDSFSVGLCYFMTMGIMK